MQIFTRASNRLFAGIVPLLICLVLAACNEEKGFNSEAWKNADACSGDDNTRLNYVSALEADVLKAGMTKSEVLDALGQPDDERDENRLVYCLGYNIIDFDSYVIELNENDLVTRFFYLQG